MIMIRFFGNALLAKRDRFDAFLTGVSSAVLIVIVRKLVLLILDLHGRKDQLVAYLVALLRYVPTIHAKIEGEKKAARESIETSVLAHIDAPRVILPESGLSGDELREVLTKKSTTEHELWDRGNLTGSVYASDSDLEQIQSEALSKFLKSNLLHPDIFPCTRQMEAEIIRMTLNLFEGDERSCGSLTTGGTESILLAVKAYRDQAGRKRPNIVIPSTAHAAFMKAGEYFGIEVRRARCDLKLSFEVDLAAMESLIDRNTIALVASAPGYPHGTMDPIPAIARMALERNIGCHVDACLGSFLLPFLRDELPYKYSFQVPGVTSISCDTHKYAYAPKGSSLLLWRSEELRKYQYTVCSDWEGGLYATPTISGSRCSSSVAATWVTLMYMGKAGYAECSAKIKAGAQLIARTVESELREDLQLMGRVDTSVVSFTTRDNSKNIFDIADYMKTKTNMRWSLAMLQKPAGVHFAVTMANVDHCAQFSEDLVSAVQQERERIRNGGTTGSSESAAIYGSTASVPKPLMNELVVDYLDVCYRVS